MKQVHKVIKCVFRYEIGVSLKNSGFSYLYGSVSYLFGYENIGCFSLMECNVLLFFWSLLPAICCCIARVYSVFPARGGNTVCTGKHCAGGLYCAQLLISCEQRTYLQEQRNVSVQILEGFGQGFDCPKVRSRLDRQQRGKMAEMAHSPLFCFRPVLPRVCYAA